MPLNTPGTGYSTAGTPSQSTDGATSVFADVVRIGRLNVDGTPAVGQARAQYVTKVVNINIAPDVLSGVAVEKVAGDGSLCLDIKLPDVQRRKNVTLEFCTDDPELRQMLTGGTLLRKGTLTAPTGVTAVASSSGGSLAASAVGYAYRVSAVDTNGETIPSAEAVTAATTGSASSVVVSWTAVTGATAYRVYGRTAGGELFIGSVAAGTNTFTDTGATVPAGAPQTSNGTGYTVGLDEVPPGQIGVPNGVSIETWTRAYVGNNPAINTGSPVPFGGGFFRNVLPRVYPTIGPRDFGSSASSFTFTGFATANPNLGTGIAGDITFALGGPFASFRDTAEPPSVIGAQAS